MAAEPVERRRGAHLIALTGYLVGLPVESVVRVALHPPHSMEFKQVRGTLRALFGRYVLREVEEGTEVTYRLEADPGIPMITNDAARQFLVQFVERMLDRIKLAAERKAPTRRVERAGAAGSQPLGPGAEEPEEEEPPVAPVAGPPAEAGGDTVETSRVEVADVATAAAPPPPAPDVRGTSPRPGRRRRRRRHRGPGRPPGAPGPGQPGG